MRKLVLSFLTLFAFSLPGSAQPRILQIDPLDNMPIVGNSGFGGIVSSGVPNEQRGPEFRRWLAPSVKIEMPNGSSGSGTIVYYDPTKNIAYIASCGHLWDRGMMKADQAAREKRQVKVITWYQNEKKLDSPKSYTGTMIFYSYRSGCDTSLVTFQPDWHPEYFPIASKDYQIKPGSRQHSCGCDGGREVAHYDVEIIGMQGEDLITRNNSPRPGRSGGGLLTDDGYYIGTCWGTSVKDGSGIGYFTPLKVIHAFWNENNYGWLLQMKPGGGLARSIPVVDRNGPQGKYSPEYIPLPSIR